MYIGCGSAFIDFRHGSVIASQSNSDGWEHSRLKHTWLTEFHQCQFRSHQPVPTNETTRPCSHNIAQHSTYNPRTTSNPFFMIYLRIPYSLMDLLCFIPLTAAFRVMESIPVPTNRLNKKNPQTFTSSMPPLPISTWAGPILLESSGVNKAVRNFNHPLWYDDHNPTARKVTYVDSDEYGYVYVDTEGTNAQPHFSSFRSDHIPFINLADDWAENSSLNGAARDRPIFNLWRRIKQWRLWSPSA